ncbi:MAG: hypothetical protein QF752_12510, partial [Planctomycetota bacterium]|nr:hypothetical protein [Planctomycetota bacterium]
MEEQSPRSPSFDDVLLVHHLLDEEILEKSRVREFLAEVVERRRSGPGCTLAGLLVEKKLFALEELAEILSSSWGDKSAALLVEDSGGRGKAEGVDGLVRDAWGQPAPASEWEEGFGRYRDLDLLGEGAMGKVLSATDPEIGRPVAIKILHPDRESHWRGIAKFRREAQITG